MNDRSKRDVSGGGGTENCVRQAEAAGIPVERIPSDPAHTQPRPGGGDEELANKERSDAQSNPDTGGDQ